MPNITVRELLTRQLRAIGADGLIVNPEMLDGRPWIEPCECCIDSDLCACDGMGLMCVAAKRWLDGELHPMEEKPRLTSTAYFPRYLTEDPK